MTQFNDIVVTPVYGPLSHQYPCQIPYHSYGTLTGLRPTPPQFYSSQEPPFAEENTNSRQQYKRATGLKKITAAQQIAQAKASYPNIYHSLSSSRNYAVSTHTNYIAPIPSSMYVNTIKSVAVGKSAYKVGLPLIAPITTKNYYPSGTRSSLRRARSGGCVAPKKKGSLYNHSLTNGQVCAWGSIVRQTY
jgi:hypothetical protein